MNINDIDLNLLRLFATVYQTRNVGRAATLLKISQPAASNGLTRLRVLVGDPLFARTHGGVIPTPTADQLAAVIGPALGSIAHVLNVREAFDPATSRHLFRMHMSDIGEARFLPPLMRALGRLAPHVRIECNLLQHGVISAMLDRGDLDFAFGYLPSIRDTQRMSLVRDRYVVMLREQHDLAKVARKRVPTLSDLRQLEFVTVRSHGETLRMLESLKLAERVRLVASHFLALPGIVRSTNLGVILPGLIAAEFAAQGGYAVIEPRLPFRDLLVSLHWSKRRERDPAHRWMRSAIQRVFPAP